MRFQLNFTNFLKFFQISKLKRGTVSGYNGIFGTETGKKQRQKTSKSVGRWKSIKKIHIKYTSIVQRWIYKEKTISPKKYIYSYDIVESMKRLLEEKRSSQHFTSQCYQ